MPCLSNNRGIDDAESADVTISMPATKTPVRLPVAKVINNMYWHPYATAESLRSTMEMKPRSDDIFVCTYPKSGSTWIQHIVHQLLGKTDYEGAVSNSSISSENPQSMSINSPVIERREASYVEMLSAPRVLKCHFPYQMVPKGGSAKYIYSCRNPKDSLNSYFHHHRAFKMYDFKEGEFDVFFDLFMTGREDSTFPVGYGDYFDHLISWLDGIEKGDENILVLKYEDMVADLPAAVVKIANFLGDGAAKLIRDREELARIVEASKISSMKINQHRFIPSTSFHCGEFIRKGGSRDWKNQFSYEQSLIMDMRFRQMLAATAAYDWWQDEMEWNEPTAEASNVAIQA